MNEELSDKSRICIDIVTTGLYWRTSRITFLGAAWDEGGNPQVKTWNLSAEEEEPEALESFMLYITPFAEIVTYNGAGFDLPYLQHKCSAYGIENILPHKSHTDLYRAIRPLRDVLKLPSMKQTELEVFLGIVREDLPEADLLGLLLLLPMLHYAAFFGGAFTVEEAVTGDDNGPVLMITCSLAGMLPRQISFLGSFCYLTAGDRRAKLLIRLYEGELKHYFHDFRNYYYLPEEDTAVHKSVGAFVDRAHRKAAIASTCYQRKKGLFIPQFSDQEMRTPVFKSDLKSTQSYLFLNSGFLENRKELHRYVQSILLNLCRPSKKEKSNKNKYGV